MSPAAGGRGRVHRLLVASCTKLASTDEWASVVAEPTTIILSLARVKATFSLPRQHATSAYHRRRCVHARAHSSGVPMGSHGREGELVSTQ